MRANAKTEHERENFKLMKISLFGKTVNLLNHIEAKKLTDEHEIIIS